MKIYSYRPPRLRPAEFDSPVAKRSRSYLLIPVALLIGIFYGLHNLPQNEMLSALVSDESVQQASSIDSVQAEDSHSPLSQMKPFLKGASPAWKLHSAPSQQAIGGGPGILKDSLQLKGALSVNYDTGTVYYSHNASNRMRIASLTKIMTAITALDLASLDEEFTVEQAATEVEPTIIGVRVGEQLSTRELIKAGLLTSGNDAMAVLAQGIGKKYGGDSSTFVAAMNEKAKSMGLRNTHFANPQGYDDPEHYSTAEDVAFIARYALQNYPEIQKISSLKEDDLSSTATHRSFHLPNWNMLIGTYPGADGIKIGNTGEAGHTTVASAQRSGVRILAVVLGADGILKRDMSAAELLNVGFAGEGIAPFPMTEDLLRTRISDWY